MKDLTAYLAPDLVLKVGDRTYRVPPPSKDVGIKLAAINAAGVAAFLALQDKCPTCGRVAAPEDLSEDTRNLLESIKDTDVGELSLGADTYRQMLDDGLPGPHVDTLALYALYYWTLGEETADQILDAQAREKEGGPKGSAPTRRSPSGRSTGSGSRKGTSTGSRSTAGTGSRTK